MNTARLSPRYEGKSRGCHCSHWAPDDGRETPETCWAVNDRQDNKLKKLLHQVGDLFELNIKLRCQKVNMLQYGGNVKKYRGKQCKGFCKIHTCILISLVTVAFACGLTKLQTNRRQDQYTR